jgi:hypothetical protein
MGGCERSLPHFLTTVNKCPATNTMCTKYNTTRLYNSSNSHSSLLDNTSIFTALASFPKQHLLSSVLPLRSSPHRTLSSICFLVYRYRLDSTLCFAPPDQLTSQKPRITCILPYARIRNRHIIVKLIGSRPCRNASVYTSARSSDRLELLHANPLSSPNTQSAVLSTSHDALPILHPIHAQKPSLARSSHSSRLGTSIRRRASQREDSLF